MKGKKIIESILRRLCWMVFLVLPILAGAQTKTIVYDGITGIYNTNIQNDTVTVTTLLPKSPAHRAGIQFRDQIITINDSLVSGKGLNSRDISSLLNGRAGESVKLEIRRKGVDSLMSFSFERDPYLFQIATYEYEYIVDSLEQWDIDDIMSDSLNSLFADPLKAKITVYSVEVGSPAADYGILPGDQVISLAEEMDKDFYYHISHGILESISADTSFTVLRDDSIIHFNVEPSLEEALQGIRSQFERDFSFNCVWLKINTENRIAEDRTYLFNCPEMRGKDSLSFYYTSQSNKVIEKKSGILVPADSRDFIYKNWHAVSVSLIKDQEQTFYMRWKAEEHVDGPLMHIIAFDTIVAHDRIERMVISAFLGMMFIISCFFLILYIAIRGRQYVYFSFYILSFGMFLYVSAGYLGEYTWSENSFLAEFVNYYQPVLISLVSIMFLFFGISYLDIKRTLVWWYRSALISIGLIGLRIIVIFLESIFHFELPELLGDIIILTWGISVGFIPLFILILPAIFRIRAGFKPGWYFLIANIVLIPLAYITLFSSAFSFTVLTLYDSVLFRILHVSGVHIAAVLQILIFSIGLAQKLRHDEKEKKLAGEQMLEQLKENEKLKDKVTRELERKVQERTREIREQKEEIESQRDEIEAQRDMVFAQKQEITDSINYAQRIQVAVLPHKEYIDGIISEYFVLYKPRDIVSGDFYWIKEVKSHLIVVAADCTGHGVPGAFMSMLGIALLNEQLGKNQLDKPGEILGQLRSKLKAMLAQHGDRQDQKDGIDMAIAIIDKDHNELQFAGANIPLYIIRMKGHPGGKEIQQYASLENEKGQLFELKGDKQPIGIYWEESDFTNHIIQLQDRDTIYVFSDGFVDQFGGEERKKFKHSKFRNLLLSVHKESMEKQKQIIENTYETWRGDNEQIDDICVIGVRV